MKVLALHHTDFIPLAENVTSSCAYGGRQAWFTEKSQRLRGCGPVAAANILCYLARSEEKYRPLYSDGTLTQAHFFTLMTEMYTALAPRLVGGVFTRRRFVQGVTRWAKSRGVPLTARVSGPRTHSRQEAMAMIRQGLERDRPVAALNLKLRYTVPPGGSNFGWHWVTITGLETGPDGRMRIVVSSWGRMVSLDWDGYWQACRKALLPGGFVWFE